MSKKIISAFLALTMLFMTACGDSSQADTSKADTTTTAAEQDNSEADSSSDSEETTTTTDDTTTTTSDTSEKEEKSSDTTTTSSTTTTTKQAVATTRATQKPVQTTKATVKVTAKSATKATVKTTPKATQPVTDLSKLSPYWRALYKMTDGTATKADYDTVRNEMLAYGKKLYPQFAVNTKLHPLITKDGKYTDSFTEAKGGTNSETEYYTALRFGTVGIKSNFASEAERWNSIYTFDTNFKTVIKNTLQDSTRFDASQTVWYITYGFENYGNGTGCYSWVCMTAFPENWK